MLLRVPTASLDENARFCGLTFRWTIPAIFEVSSGSHYQPQSIATKTQPAIIVWSGLGWTDVRIDLETRTYVRYKC